MTKKEIQIKLGERIVKLREAKGLKQIDLANKLELDDSAIRRIEKGRTNPTLETLYKLSNALEISLSELVNFDD
jgi:transcriptional regulator with XRE-family HTH domain